MSEESLPLRQWPAGIRQASVPANENALRVQALLSRALSVENDAPGTEYNGAVYIVGSAPTGAFSTFSEHDIALFEFGSWYAWAPPLDTSMVVNDVRKVFDGTEWVDDPSIGSGWGDTDDVPEGATNLYFTAARVRDTLLTGLSLASSAVISATDSVLSAFGKLQAQITALGSTVSGLITQTITDGDTTHAPSGDAVFDALAGKETAGAAAAALAAANAYTDGEIATREPVVAPGTDAQVWRGDKAWANWINGDWRVGTSSGLFGSGRELVVSAGTSGNNIAHMSFQGSRTVNGIFGTMNYYHQANLVVSMGSARDGADDAGYWAISTKPTAGPLTNRLRILSDGSIIIGAGAVSNGAGVMQFAGNAVPFTNLGGTSGGASYRWSTTYTANLDANASIVHSGVITPTTLAASANDYSPTGYADTHLFRIAASVAVNLTGMQGGVAGRRIVLTNIGANNIILSHDSASSAAANRWYGANNASVTLRPNGTVEAIYDATSQRWRIFGP